MTDAATPRAVFDRLIQGITDGRWRELADLYAEDAVVDRPLLAPRPDRLEGREAVRAQFEAAADGPYRLRAANIRVHETTDPEVIIAEFDYDITFAPTGRRLTAANVQLLRVRDGQIVETRDYHDHLRLAAVSERAEELAAAVTATTSAA
jgi:ketosteroid isomerase-like protein